MKDILRSKPWIGECSECGKTLPCYTPKGGDGSLQVPRKHKANGKRCLGSFSEALNVRASSASAEEGGN